MRVVQEWVLEERQYRYLLHFVLHHLHVAEVTTPELMAKNAEDAWHDFYLKHFDKVAQSYSPAVAFPLFDTTDLGLSTQLVVTLQQRQDALNDYVREQLRPQTRQLLMTTQAISGVQAPLLQMLGEDLNRMLQGECIYTQERFVTVRLRAETRRYLGQLVQLPPALLNRLLLEDGYPGVFVRRRHFWNYLLFCLERFCRSEGRKLRRAQQRQEPLSLEPKAREDRGFSVAQSDPTSNPETLILQAEQQRTARENILQGLQSLRPSYRDVLVKHYYEEMSVAQIAAVTDLSEANVKVRLFRGRQQLFDILQHVSKRE